MNLFYMIQRRSSDLETQGAVKLVKLRRAGDSWRGLQLSPGARLMIRDIRRFAEMRTFPDQCGWMVETEGEAELIVRMLDQDGKELSGRRFSGGFQSVWLPWPEALSRRIDLHIELLQNGDSNGAAAFLGVNRVHTRDWLYSLALGSGVEIGPGPSPQILPNEQRTVRYVEQMPPDRWNELYNAHGKYPVQRKLWSNYIVGDAANLPVTDNELDFIFGSHIFEHLVNPIGHLRLWHEKLKPDGKIICIVPAISGAKDDFQRPGSLAEWLAEESEDIWQPQPRHYARYLRRPLDDERTRGMIKNAASIHTHFYNNSNMADLLEYALEKLNFSDFAIQHEGNAKDFHFVLVK